MRSRRHGARPTVDLTAVIASTAILRGAVTVGPGTRILHGAVLTTESGSVTVGARCVIMEHAVIRGTRAPPSDHRRACPDRPTRLPERLPDRGLGVHRHRRDGFQGGSDESG